ncbi:HTH_48 domain-containing protein [Trichonephila clavipes]|nr:HTH_48 domain-containing protein [Trichonephila clavipes]
MRMIDLDGYVICILILSTTVLWDFYQGSKNARPIFEYSFQQTISSYPGGKEMSLSRIAATELRTALSGMSQYMSEFMFPTTGTKGPGPNQGKKPYYDAATINRTGASSFAAPGKEKTPSGETVRIMRAHISPCLTKIGREDKIAQVKTEVRSDRCLTVREIAQECHISVGSCDEILRKDLNVRRVSAKFVPRLLTEDQQFQRLATSSDLFQSASDDPESMKLIITGDESWVYGYDPETKQQSSQWKTPGSPRPKKARQVRSKIKVMLIVFFDADGLVNFEYASQGQTMNKELCLDVMRRLREAIRRKRPCCGRPFAECFIMTEPQRTPPIFLCSSSRQNTEQSK